MLRMDPEQLPRLIAIEEDTRRLLVEAKAKGWEGEVNGLETTLLHIKEVSGWRSRDRGDRTHPTPRRHRVAR